MKKKNRKIKKRYSKLLYIKLLKLLIINIGKACQKHFVNQSA